MSDLPDAVRAFLAQKHIAVAGVSRAGNSPANAILRKLRDTGHTVYAINPGATEIEGGPCYAGLMSVPTTIDAVVAVTPPDATLEIARACVTLGIRHLWMHQSFRRLGTSVSEEALRLCAEHNVSVIPGACPMMFCEPVDIAHKCARWLLGATGRMNGIS